MVKENRVRQLSGRRHKTTQTKSRAQKWHRANQLNSKSQRRQTSAEQTLGSAPNGQTVAAVLDSQLLTSHESDTGKDRGPVTTGVRLEKADSKLLEADSKMPEAWEASATAPFHTPKQAPVPGTPNSRLWCGWQEPNSCRGANAKQRRGKTKQSSG